ncbi:MAG TPA: NAD(P)/FAD-dependent oxidoreductase [Actinomycetota bacterium]|jgi:phytoene dehydrogenase-like protein|nr:NAD(P)/FAD-dependent oxidoreductase [Actinomycetota bacterium]
MPERTTYDALVVGGGHNGLVCAAYLCRAGLRTLVLERREVVGGRCVGDKSASGWRMGGAMGPVSALRKDVVSELGLGLEVRSPDPQVFAPLEGGGGLFLWADPARTRDEIARLSPADATAYGDFAARFEEAASRLAPLLTYPATWAHARRVLRRSPIEDLYRETVEASIGEVCEDRFASDSLKGVLAWQALMDSAAGPWTPGTAYLYVHRLADAAGAQGACGLVRGGGEALTRSLAEAVRSGGGEILTQAEVAAIKPAPDRRRAAGVVLSSGQEVHAPVVCSSADPKRTLSLVDPSLLPSELVEEVSLLPTAGCLVRVDCALSGLPRFAGLPARTEPGPEHLGAIVVAPSLGYLEQGAAAASEGRPAPAMALEAWIQPAIQGSAGEPSRRRARLLSIFAQYAPYELASGTWEERREEIGDAVVSSLERHCSGLSDLIEERIVLGPPDLEEEFGVTGGHILHGEMLPDWMYERRPAPTWHRYRAPVAGLYLCGSGTHPGGGLTGAPGRNAARAVLEDLSASGAREALLTERPQ